MTTTLMLAIATIHRLSCLMLSTQSTLTSLTGPLSILCRSDTIEKVDLLILSITSMITMSLEDSKAGRDLHPKEDANDTTLTRVRARMRGRFAASLLSRAARKRRRKRTKRSKSTLAEVCIAHQRTCPMIDTGSVPILLRLWTRRS